MNLFLVAAFLKPTKKQKDEEGRGGEVVLPVTTVVAADQSSAIRKALRQIPEQYQDVDEDRLEVRAIPFGS